MMAAYIVRGPPLLVGSGGRDGRQIKAVEWRERAPHRPGRR